MGAGASVLSRWTSLVTAHLDRVAAREAANVEAAAELLAGAWMAGRRLYGFGCNHSGLLIDDLFYRAGTPVFMNPLHVPGLRLDTGSPLLGSELEKLPGLAHRVLDTTALEPGDVLLVVSTSGRNAVPVEMARGGRERRLRVVALTSRAAGGDDARLAHLADAVMDTDVPRGDAALVLDGLDQPVGPLSTIVGAFLLHAWLARTAEMLLERGVDPPVLVSGNQPGGMERNRAVLIRVGNRVGWAPR
jgi:uncharacterized phosphosugar-binding protein